MELSDIYAIAFDSSKRELLLSLQRAIKSVSKDLLETVIGEVAGDERPEIADALRHVFDRNVVQTTLSLQKQEAYLRNICETFFVVVIESLQKRQMEEDEIRVEASIQTPEELLISTNEQLHSERIVSGMRLSFVNAYSTPFDADKKKISAMIYSWELWKRDLQIQCSPDNSLDFLSVGPRIMRKLHALGVTDVKTLCESPSAPIKAIPGVSKAGYESFRLSMLDRGYILEK